MLLNHNDAKCYISFDIIISSRHEVVNKFLLYNATTSSSAVCSCSKQL